jgi:hypothetical protein
MMRKQSFLTVLLTAAVMAASAPASAGTWHFSYQGFMNAESGQFDPNKMLTGDFVGEDRNGDGIIGAAELSDLIIDGYTYLANNATEGCMRDPIRLACTLDSFSYALTGQLQFSARYEYWYDSIFDVGTYVTGEYFSKVSSSPGNPTHTQRWEWTDQTTFAITPAPVPEPAVALLLPAGLAVLAAARRRRDKIAL